MDQQRTRRPGGELPGRTVAKIGCTPVGSTDDDLSDDITVLVEPRLLGVLDLPAEAIEIVQESEVFSLDSPPEALPAEVAGPPVVEPALLATALFGALLGCFAAVWWVLG